MDRIIEEKQIELSLVKKLGSQTTDMVILLNKLVQELEGVNSDVEKVDKIMSNWGFITKCISASSISLLQYQEQDYEKGAWNDQGKSSLSSDNEQKATASAEQESQTKVPLPEVMVRLGLNNSSTN
ncbi:hypothetical protein ACO0QE_004753 [Hanseniaspora vineae]